MASLRERAVEAGLIRVIPMLPSDPNYYRCGRKVPYATVAEAFAVAARLSETSPDGKKICIYPCRWLHPGLYHIGNRYIRRDELEKQLTAIKGQNVGLLGKLKQAENQLAQARDARDGWKLLVQAYRDSLNTYPRINKLLAHFGLQLGASVEKEKL